MGDIDVDFFLDTLKQLIMSSTVESIIKEKHQLESLEEEIKYMRGFLKVTEKKRNEHSELMNLVKKIKHVISEAENVMELFVVQAFKANQNRDHLSLDLESVKNEIKTLTAEVEQIYDENMCAINGVVGKKIEHSFSKSGGGSCLSGLSNTSKVTEETTVVVGFKEEVEKLMGKLTDRGEGGQLEIISIVGTGGGGKTTLAKEVYDNPLMSHTFEIRAWVNISQNYDKTMKRNLLSRILELASPRNHGDYEKSSEDKLGEDTLKCLRGKKYLIVMDDIWNIEAWNDIQRSLPNECNGSKVLFTTRESLEPEGINYVCHCLAPLPDSFSWELLQKKVFGKKCCPPELVGIGKHIVGKCGGLPLVVVTIAGILAVEDKTLNVWEEVSKHLSAIIAKNQNDCMEILELSYNHLPLHLKACFVYIGGFPEDSEILIRELIWLWIAEGFIQQSEGNKSVEDVAKDYLRSLIDRNLVMVAWKNSSGEIKACRIHDLLRTLCLKKAEEDNFLVPIYGDDTFSPSAENSHRRIFIGNQFFQEISNLKPCSRNLRSFLCLSSQNSTPTKLSFFVKNFELLRVLHFISTQCEGKIGHLVHLRYLALELPIDISNFAPPFSFLFNLETLYLRDSSSVLEYWKSILLPRDIFRMVRLRHLYAKGGVFKFHSCKCYISCPCSCYDVKDGISFDPSPKLDSLQTLHPLCSCEKCKNFLVRTPNLKKLGLHGDLMCPWSNVLKLPNLEFMKRLETLSFKHCESPKKATTFPPELKFPPTITRLTLENTCLKWEELSILQTLPSLEVLKLSMRACMGKIWDTSELDGFCQLKYLRLQDLDIKEWNASEDQFPRLEVIVVERCVYLKQIPIAFAYLNELRQITVWSSRGSAEKSAEEILRVLRETRGDDDYINLWARYNIY